MATWAFTGQRTDGVSTVTVGGTDRIWFTAGVNITDNVVVSSYQDGTHVTDNTDAHSASCGGAGGHLNNLKYASSTTLSINGAGTVTLSGTVPTTAQMPFKFNFSDAASVATSSAKFYFYDGTTDATPMAGVTVQAIEKGNTTWTAANGSGAGLTIANQAAATSHDFFVGCSLSPTSTGAKTGKMKITLTYV
jgi:hypothetical protein